MKKQLKLIGVLMITIGFMVTGCSCNEGGSKDTPPASGIIPGKVIITNIITGENEITLSWSNDEYTDHVDLRYTEGSVSEQINTTGQTYTIEGLAPETAYTITVKAVNSEGDFSDPNTFTVSTTASGSGTHEFVKIYSAEDLDDVSDDLDGHYLLNANIDLSGYSAGEGWEPIGNDSDRFAGTFIGNGHVISNLTINRESSDYQGLFASVDLNGRIENLGLENVNVKGQSFTGGLVGRNIGTISGCYAKGTVTGTGLHTGGLVGYNHEEISNCYAEVEVNGTKETGGLAGVSGKTISDSYAIGKVTGTDEKTGGLVGIVYTTISNCYATGEVNGMKYTGGLAGYNQNGTISESYATGKVTGTDENTGGLIGINSPSGEILNSYATGEVEGISYTGGLAGYNKGTISESYATTGKVTGIGNYTGGLVGFNENEISKCYATREVEGTTYTGGLVGDNNTTGGIISDSYATGKVTGTDYVGGLVGVIYNGSKVSNSYATGEATGDTLTGGLAGYKGALPAEVSNCYYDEQTTGQHDNTGKGLPKSTIDMKKEITFTDGGWDFVGETTNGEDEIWSIDNSQVINSGYPYLTAIMPE